MRWLRLLLFFLVAAALVSSWGSPADLLKQFLSQIVLLAVVVFGIRRIARFNLLGVFLVVVCTSLLPAAMGLLSQPDAFYRAQGRFAFAELVLLLALPLIAWRLRGDGERA